MRRKIIVDTNFWLIPAQFRVDIFSEIERICHFNYGIFMLDETLDELKNIMKKGSGKDKKAAKLAMSLIKIKEPGIIKRPSRRPYKDVDTLILENADKDTIVATVDLELKDELLRRGIQVIILRKKSYLMFAKKGLD